MPAYAERESYTGIRRKIFNMLKIGRRTRRTTTYASILRRIPACFSMLLTYTKLTHNVFNVCQRFRQIFSYVGIRWLKRQGVTAAWIVERQPFNRLRYMIVGYTLPRAMHTLDCRWAYVVNADNTLSIRWYKLSITYRNVLCTLIIRYAYVQLVRNTPKIWKKHQ